MRVFLRLVAFCTVVALVVVTMEAVRVRSVREEDRAAMRIGLEDVTRRIRTTTANLATVLDLNNRSILAKARAFARLVAEDPSLLTDHARFAALCKPLDVEELHVSDEKGVLIQCVPEGSLGFNMDSADQSRPFMKAIVDKGFEMVQDPSVKPTDGKLFQYAGVARLDKPGIVQVGHRAERVQEARRLADVDSIAMSARVGRDGRVQIAARTAGGPASSAFEIEREGGVRKYVLETDVGAHRVRVTMPVHGFWLADDAGFWALLALDALVLLACLVARLDPVRQAFLQNVSALRFLFGDLPAAAAPRRRWRGNPVVLACGLAFVVLVAGSWAYISYRGRVAVEERLRNAAADMHDDIDKCVDQQLFYQGNVICKLYGSPEAMNDEIVREVMRRYDLDELNVIDARGRIVAGDPSVHDVDMAADPVTAPFNSLLAGQTTYSQPFRASIAAPERRFKYVGVAFPLPAKGYLQIGFSEPRLKDELDYRFAALADDWRIGERGYFIVAKEETGEIDSCGKLGADGRQVETAGETLAGVGFEVADAPKRPDEFFTARLFGEDCLCLTEVMNYHRYIAAIPMSEISGNSRRTLVTAAAALFLLILLVAVFMTRLTDLVASLKGFIEENRARVEKDMAMAKAIQTNVLPTVFPPYPNLVDRIDLYARMRTAREVGGDFYDFYFVASGRMALVIADVSGKGVPAALFMMRAKTTLQALLKGGMDVADAVTEANNRLSENNEANMFVTAWIGIVELATGRVEFVNAGHNPPLVKRADGSVSYLSAKCGPPLAAIGGVNYRRGELVLKPNDGLFLYTDGVTEAANPALELYGEPRLKSELENLLGDRSSQGVLNGILSSVDRFAAGAEQADDITMLAFKVLKLGQAGE